jgi:hypothetical protein
LGILPLSWFRRQLVEPGKPDQFNDLVLTKVAIDLVIGNVTKPSGTRAIGEAVFEIDPEAGLEALCVVSPVPRQRLRFIMGISRILITSSLKQGSDPASAVRAVHAITDHCQQNGGHRVHNCHTTHDGALRHSLLPVKHSRGF